MTRPWNTGGYTPGMILTFANASARQSCYGSDPRLPKPGELFMAVRHGGDSFWYFAPLEHNDEGDFRADLSEEFCGYAWATRYKIQPNEREAYLLLAGETVKLKEKPQ